MNPGQLKLTLWVPVIFYTNEPFLINSQALKLFSSSVYHNNMFLSNHYTICLSQGGNKTISKSFPCLHVSGHGSINIIQADRSRAPNLILLAKFNYMQIPKTTALLSLVFFVSDAMINNHPIAASSLLGKCRCTNTRADVQWSSQVCRSMRCLWRISKSLTWFPFNV